MEREGWGVLEAGLSTAGQRKNRTEAGIWGMKSGRQQGELGPEIGCMGFIGLGGLEKGGRRSIQFWGWPGYSWEQH